MSTQSSDNNKRIAMNTFFRILFLIDCIVVYEAMLYSKDVEITENIMSEEQYNEFAESLHKGGFGKYDKGRYTTKVP